MVAVRTAVCKEKLEETRAAARLEMMQRRSQLCLKKHCAFLVSEVRPKRKSRMHIRMRLQMLFRRIQGFLRQLRLLCSAAERMTTIISAFYSSFRSDGVVSATKSASVICVK